MLQGELRDIFGREVLRMHLIVAGFGDVPVLAEEAAHVAARRAHAENSSARQKMIERFFLDGIDLKGRGRAVTQAVEFAALIDANEAEARLAGIDVAVPRTEVAVDAVVGFGLPPEGLVERAGLSGGSSGRSYESAFCFEYTPADRMRWAAGAERCCLRWALVVTALGLATFFSPVQEVLHLIAVFPREAEEFRGVQVCGFAPKKCFEAPAQVRALPGRESIAFRGHPVVAEHLQHSMWKRTARAALCILADSLSSLGRKDVRGPAAS